MFGGGDNERKTQMNQMLLDESFRYIRDAILTGCVHLMCLRFCLSYFDGNSNNSAYAE